MRFSRPRWLITLTILAAAAPVRAAAPPDCYVRQATWLDTMRASCQALAARGDDRLTRRPLPDFGRSDWTVTVWLRTTAEGTIVAKAPEKGKWVPQGKSLFVHAGKVVFDVGWVGAITSTRVGSTNCVPVITYVN